MKLARLTTREAGIPLAFTRAVLHLTGLQQKSFLRAAAAFEWETRRPGFRRRKPSCVASPLGSSPP